MKLVDLETRAIAEKSRALCSADLSAPGPSGYGKAVRLISENFLSSSHLIFFFFLPAL